MEETGLVFRPFVSAWIVLALALVAAVLTLRRYLRSRSRVSARFSLLLFGLRMVAIASLSLCLLRPSMQATHYQVVKRPLLVLVDQSRSMREIADTPEDVSRLAALNQVLKDNAEALEALEERYEVVKAAFARGLLARAGGRTEALDHYSAYGLALKQAVAELGGGATEAVVMMGDGAHNFGPPDPVEVAAALNEQGVPVYTVGVGRGKPTSGLRDVKLTRMSAPETALLFTTFTVRPELLLRGCRGRQVRVVLEVEGMEPQQQTVAVAHSEEVVPLEFKVTPETVGQKKLVVRAEPVPEEILLTNNSYTSFVQVKSGGVRVGLFDTVRPESKFIVRAIRGARHVAARRLLILPGQQLPRPQTDPSRYDVYVLGDLEAGALLPSRMVGIGKAVREEGKGLLVLMTETSGGPQGWKGTALEGLLPVRLGPAATVATGERSFLVPPEHADHPAIALAEAPRETLSAWDGMPPLSGALTGLEPKRGATVLARDQQGNPLLVVQRSGAGRVACLMVDTTFRWFFTRRNTQDQYRRFWRQLVLWTAGREEERARAVQLELSKKRLLLEEELKLTVHVRDKAGEAVRDAQLELRVSGPQEHQQQMSYSFSREEAAYVARYSPQGAGDYKVSAVAERAGMTLGRDAGYFHADSRDLELEDPMADLGLLRRIAAVTSETGGRYYHYSRAGDLLEALQRGGNALKLTTRRRKDIWDRWPLFALFAGCLAAEWALRKWRGLP